MKDPWRVLDNGGETMDIREIPRLAVSVGNFNVSDAANQPLLFPQERQARLSPDGRASQAEPLW